MAHFKRKRSRTSGHPHGSSRGYWLRHWPRWWDVMFHTRPRRRRDAELTHRIMHGTLDPDNAAWDPGNTRPHNYYW